MAKTKADKTTYVCTECGWTTTKWVGQCRDCGAWTSMEEQLPAPTNARTAPAAITKAALPIIDVRGEEATHRTTGVSEFDRVLGGGLVPGSVVLLAGEPGAGKSTLLIDVAANLAVEHSRTNSPTQGTVLYVTGEESASQVRLRADRVGAIHQNLYLAAETDLGAALSHIDQLNPAVLVVDSIQTISSSDITGAPGNASQIREVAGALIGEAKRRNMATIIVGHVTKEGTIAGPRLLEHLVDVVCNVEGDRHSQLRIVRAVKNRYGSTDEIGCFEMRDSGFIGLADPSGLFTSRTDPTPGSCVVLTVEGRRPLAVEVQALANPIEHGNPRRYTNGIDLARVNMLAAVLTGRLGYPLHRCELYVSAVGGAKITEPAADLAIAMAIISAAEKKALPDKLAVIGEVSLSAEIRPVTGLERRINEAARLGYKRLVIPATDILPTAPDGVKLIPTASLHDMAQHIVNTNATASGDRIPGQGPHH